MCPQCALTRRCSWHEMINLFQSTCAEVSSQHISLQCPSLNEKIRFTLERLSHQEKVSFHGRGVPGGQLQNVSLFNELVGRVNNVLLLAQHFIYLHQLLQILLNEEMYFIGRLCLKESTEIERKRFETCSYRFPYGGVGVSSCCGNYF